jgi:DNA-binding IclR family transcriptional regulator
LARTARQEAAAAMYEQREFEARTPETLQRTEELRQELKWKKREVQVGRALVDNDPIYLQVSCAIFRIGR